MFARDRAPNPAGWRNFRLDRQVPYGPAAMDGIIGQAEVRRRFGMDSLASGEGNITPARSGLIDILLVEDSPTDAELAREVLLEARVRSNLYLVKDGDSAMAFLKHEWPYPSSPRPDLILLDLNLPGKDGREVLAEVKSDDELKQIPVVVLSASPADEDVANAYACQANAYIRKPSDLDEFVECMKLLEAFWLSMVRLPPPR
jgi:two-component system, chemotaxis family, response regulator Rcp1